MRSSRLFPVILLATLGLQLGACGSGGEKGDGPHFDVDGGAGDVNDGGDPGGPAVSMAALNARVLPGFECDPDATGPGGMVWCASYDLSLSLTNDTDHPMERIERLVVELDGAMVDTTWRFTCDRTPWIAGPRANTGVIDLSLMWSYGDFGPSIGFVCPESSGDKFVSLGYPALPDAPTTGSLTLTVHGILDDATAWAAARTTQLE